MSWSQARQSEDLSDSITILLGSAIRLLRGTCGIFVLSNEAFDPQSSEEYTLYRLTRAEAGLVLSHTHTGRAPGSAHPLVKEAAAPELVGQLGVYSGAPEENGDILPAVERCALFVHDASGALGVLHWLRTAGAISPVEQAGGANGAADGLPIFIAHLAAGLRAALQARSLLQEQRRLAAIFQQSAEGILTVDTALRIIDFNPAMERLTGWSEGEVLGRFYYEVLRPRDRQGNDLGLRGSPILQAFAGQAVVNREMSFATRDGQYFDVRVTASCVRSARGEPISGILNVRDVTREREQEEQRSTFISVVSHELQTPIAIIKGYASTLARADAALSPETLRSRLQAIEEEADSLNKLVGNLLYASRIQAGGLHMDITPLDMPPLIRKVARRQQVRSQDAAIALDIPAHVPPVMADRDRIEEVLQNLLDNAIKYSPGRANITVACRFTGEEVIVSVSDTGMGISLREQEQIFERFHRAGNSGTRSTQGAGLGLYICRSIVEAHGGRIWVESALHSGSTFSFSLPREEKARLPMVVF